MCIVGSPTNPFSPGSPSDLFETQIWPCHTVAETHRWIPRVWRIKWKSIAWPTQACWLQLLTSSVASPHSPLDSHPGPPLLLWTNSRWHSFLASSTSQLISIYLVLRLNATSSKEFSLSTSSPCHTHIQARCIYPLTCSCAQLYLLYLQL